ncbi:hypothetical protein CspeluHIS016_0112280 [Cutaneotrichosporon spelunceum]|uniref:Uncharacterized protein n=1 Tax=Cutaneotrichosporon spelunceum TaxID=1672016 RepID=A0AAD3TQH2_9TREE|nr:hypothetical protein CspeluHIS016_0112280 [Cutaneotrichosporon spelunceum]
MDLDRALRELRGNDSRNAQAGPSRAKSTRPRSHGVPGKRRMVDETLVSGYDYAEPKRKVRQHTRAPSQTSLTSFVKTSPSTKNRVQAGWYAGQSRSGCGSLSGSNTAPSAKRNGPSASTSPRAILGGGSTEDAIELSDDSLPTERTTAPSAPCELVSQAHSHSQAHQPSLQVLPPTTKRRPPPKVARNSQLPIIISDSDEEAPIVGRPRRQATMISTKKRFYDPRILVPETAVSHGPHNQATKIPKKQLYDPRILLPETVVSQRQGRVLVEETVLPSPRNTAAVASQSSIAPDSPMPAAAAVALDDSGKSEPQRTRQPKRARSAATPEERQERQRRANERIMTPAPILELPSILDGLAKTPTPKKLAPKESVPPAAANSAKRRLFAVNANLDDESYRPNPGTVLARPVKPDRAARYQANRPRRSLPVPGQYALPPADTPIQQWPTKPGTLHDGSSAHVVQPQECDSILVPAQYPAPEALEEDAGGSATEYDDAGSNFGLDLYADFAQFAGSPSAQSILNTPAKRSLVRLSVSPAALKAFQSPGASKIELAAVAGGSVLGSGPSEHFGVPSNASESAAPLSPTARLLAEDKERERKAVEERERAQKAAAEREANNRAQFEAIKLLEGSDESDDGEELRLSQVFREIQRTPSPGLRRSFRQRLSVFKVSDDAHDPSWPQRPKFKSNPDHSKLFRELGRDKERGMTTAYIEATISASASPEPRQLDPVNISGVDEAVLEEAQRIQREAARKEEREAVHPVFWEEDTRFAVRGSLLPLRCASEDPAVEMLKEVYDESTLAKLISCLPMPSSTDVLVNEWLFELAFCARDEELAYAALERLLEFIANSSAEPAESPDGLFWLMISVWYQLGAKVREPESHLVRVTRDRATASTFICHIASTAANNGWFGSHCAWVMLCHLAVLAGDSSTSPTLQRQIEAATTDLFELVFKEIRHVSMIAKELASLELARQVRSVLALGQRTDASRAAVRWATTGMLLPNYTQAIEEEGETRPSVHRVLQGLDRIEDEIRSENADYGHVSNLLALWCAGLTDLDDGWANVPEIKVLVRDTLRLRDLVRESPDDPATSEVKARLQLIHHIVKLHVQAATDREERARIVGKGLEVGERGQTRLSFGRGDGEQSDEGVREGPSFMG